MKKNFISHKKAIYYILEQDDINSLNIFDNPYMNKVYIDLVKETKISYNLVKNKKDIKTITESLDKKRSLVRKFKNITDITWLL